MEFDEPKSLSVFLKAAFMNYDEEDITVKDDKEIYGAKILLPGNDQTVHNFLQEYAETCLMDLKSLKNSHLKRNIQIYMIPHEHDYNSICQYIAAREPLYRQNVV